ncbi:type II toxin-antitoxin system VapC family toxin [Microbacterium sp. NPDC057650]|uniref:type II toxin-antitoxin system VapC family toxin n=1 Tax=unclassified Microbacterium TaxID=2609290 RepID=UPI003673193D
MIVVDASVLVEALPAMGEPNALRDRLAHEQLTAPDVLPLEVASALRGLNRAAKLPDAKLDAAVRDLARLRIGLHPSMPLIPRIMTLRQNFSAYDASYVALAELFGCPLLTFDKRLAKAAKKHCMIEIALE